MKWYTSVISKFICIWGLIYCVSLPAYFGYLTSFTYRRGFVVGTVVINCFVVSMMVMGVLVESVACSYFYIALDNIF